MTSVVAACSGSRPSATRPNRSTHVPYANTTSILPALRMVRWPLGALQSLQLMHQVVAGICQRLQHVIERHFPEASAARRRQLAQQQAGHGELHSSLTSRVRMLCTAHCWAAQPGTDQAS
jgi:hypothetical protein